jgi:hypothetical protein
VAAEEELQKAVELGHLHHGVPYITLILDGGWCKGYTNTRIML